MTYETLRHFADSWGLLIMTLVYLALAGWAFLPPNRSRNEAAANMIFEDEDHG